MANDHIADVGKNVLMIDANSIKYREKDEYCGNGNCRPMLFVTKEDIDEMPTVDAVKVVRCGTCIYYAEVKGKDSGKPCGYGSCTKPFHMAGIITNEDFCSFGERKVYGNSQD